MQVVKVWTLLLHSWKKKTLSSNYFLFLASYLHVKGYIPMILSLEVLATRPHLRLLECPHKQNTITWDPVSTKPDYPITIAWQGELQNMTIALYWWLCTWHKKCRGPSPCVMFAYSFTPLWDKSEWNFIGRKIGLHTTLNFYPRTRLISTNFTFPVNTNLLWDKRYSFTGDYNQMWL